MLANQHARLTFCCCSCCGAIQRPGESHERPHARMRGHSRAVTGQTPSQHPQAACQVALRGLCNLTTPAYSTLSAPHRHHWDHLQLPLSTLKNFCIHKTHCAVAAPRRRDTIATPTPDSCLDGRLPIAERHAQQTSRPVRGHLANSHCRIAAKLGLVTAWEQLRQFLQQLLPESRRIHGAAHASSVAGSTQCLNA
jgi:hypothetical protein